MELPPLTETMLGRHYANCIMHWKISNISLALCSSSTLIPGPMFALSGPVMTQWKMSLNISPENDSIQLYLEMLDHKIKNLKVRVHWIAYAMDPKAGGVAVKIERVHTCIPNYKWKVDIFELYSVIEKLPDASPDILRLRCAMLVQFGYKPEFPTVDIPVGVMELSSDLSKLLKESVYPDVTIRLGRDQFPLHKAMLWPRSQKIASLVRPSVDNKTISLYLNDKPALEAVFNYLYSGNLKFILSEPTITICDYIERMGIPELKDVYPLEKLRLESKIEANEYVFSWTIQDFRNVKESLCGEELQQRDMESRWRLHLHPSGLPGASEHHKNFLHIEAELLVSAKSLDVCIEFSSVNKKGGILHSRRIHGTMRPQERLGLEFFRMGGTNMEKCLIEGDFYLRFTLRIATGEITPILIDDQLPVAMPTNNEKTFTVLSEMMSNLLATENYSDVTLMVDGHEFKAHRFLLAVRSQAFKHMLCGTAKEDSGITLPIPNIKAHIFRVFLEFLYTGKLNDLDPNVLMRLYDISCSFNVTSLKLICADYLVKFITPMNALKFLAWSHDRKESTVKSGALQTIGLLEYAILGHPDWPLLSSSNPPLLDEILEFLERNCPDDPRRHRVKDIKKEKN